MQFFAGWITEYSLSVDNLFVFLLIMARFCVPAGAAAVRAHVGHRHRPRRCARSSSRSGAAVIERYSWVFYLFGAFLVFTAVKLAREGETDDDEYEENALVRWVVARAADDAGLPRHEAARARRRPEAAGPRCSSCCVSLGTTDLLFALDSIPAIFGLTQEPYIVFAANVFALLGLRQLYFLLGDLLNRLVYLSIGLAIMLGFIGVKLVLEALHTNRVPFINGGEPFDGAGAVDRAVSLAFIVVVLTVTDRGEPGGVPT